MGRTAVMPVSEYLTIRRSYVDVYGKTEDRLIPAKAWIEKTYRRAGVRVRWKNQEFVRSKR